MLGDERTRRRGSRVKSGIVKGRKAPRWTVAFLRALERTGDARAAAKDAAIDHSTAYARRRTHADFAGAWRGALAAYEAWAKGEEEDAAVAALKDRPSPGLPAASPTCPASGRGAQLRRAGHDRWSDRKEARFFDELAGTANVRRAAAAAGVSTNAVYARRMREPVVREKWAAVLECARAAIEMKLFAAGNRSFEPDEIDTGEIEPRVSVGEAIKIAQLNAANARREPAPEPYDMEAIRRRLEQKMKVLRDQDFAEKTAAGWSHDAEHDCLVPPGWAKVAR